MSLNNPDYQYIEIVCKPCPFCGEVPNVLHIVDPPIYPKPVYVVECKNMGCVLGRIGFCEDMDHLIELWNNRK